MDPFQIFLARPTFRGDVRERSRPVDGWEVEGLVDGWKEGRGPLNGWTEVGRLVNGLKEVGGSVDG